VTWGIEVSDTEFLRFVGGPEDGEYLEVAKGDNQYKVFEKTKPKLIAHEGIKPNNDEAKTLVYVRRGRDMVFNS